MTIFVLLFWFKKFLCGCLYTVYDNFHVIVNVGSG